MVVDVDGTAIEDRVNEFEERKVGAPVGAVDGEEAEHRCGQVVEVGIRMAHRLVRFLGGRIDRKRRVGLFHLVKRHLFVGAIDGRGGGHQQVLDLQTLGGLHHVEGADHVAFDIGAGVFQRVANARLGREMHDDVGGEIVSDFV